MKKTSRKTRVATAVRATSQASTSQVSAAPIVKKLPKTTAVNASKLTLSYNQKKELQEIQKLAKQLDDAILPMVVIHPDTEAQYLTPPLSESIQSILDNYNKVTQELSTPHEAGTVSAYRVQYPDTMFIANILEHIAHINLVTQKRTDATTPQQEQLLDIDDRISKVCLEMLNLLNKHNLNKGKDFSLLSLALALNKNSKSKNFTKKFIRYGAQILHNMCQVIADIDTKNYIQTAMRSNIFSSNIQDTMDKNEAAFKLNFIRYLEKTNPNPNISALKKLVTSDDGSIEEKSEAVLEFCEDPSYKELLKRILKKDLEWSPDFIKKQQEEAEREAKQKQEELEAQEERRLEIVKELEAGEAPKTPTKKGKKKKASSTSPVEEPEIRDPNADDIADDMTDATFARLKYSLYHPESQGETSRIFKYMQVGTDLKRELTIFTPRPTDQVISLSEHPSIPKKTRTKLIESQMYKDIVDMFGGLYIVMPYFAIHNRVHISDESNNSVEKHVQSLAQSVINTDTSDLEKHKTNMRNNKPVTYFVGREMLGDGRAKIYPCARLDPVGRTERGLVDISYYTKSHQETGTNYTSVPIQSKDQTGKMQFVFQPASV